ncbi:MAG: YeeE/YedE thiosulfate transporter family protein [Candidatus Eisenbacteria bacterium]
MNTVGYFAALGGGSLDPLDHPGVYMLLGTFVGGMISGIWNHRFRFETRRGPRISLAGRWALALVGGALMGYGARMARGCTSGQALSGGAVLSVGSFAFMFAVFAGAYALAYFVRKVWN